MMEKRLNMLLLMFGLKVLAAIAVALTVVLFTVLFIEDRIFGKTASDKLDALKNNSYTAYEFNAPEKLWCSVHVKDGEEEQDHTKNYYREYNANVTVMYKFHIILTSFFKTESL